MDIPFHSSVVAPDDPGQPACWFIFRGYDLLIYDGGATARVPLPGDPAELGLGLLRQKYLGRLETPDGDLHCYAGEVAAEAAPPEGMLFHGLRALYGRLDEPSFWIAGRAVQIVDWDRTHQYCGRCGSRTEDQPRERAKICPVCGLTSYPRLAPAIIVRVERTTAEGAGEILLARNHRFPAGMYSVLAGFVEPGETLEECVRREVYEESGIRLDNIRYFGSQPWPFPHSLMIAFVACYAGGEIIVEEAELDDARWFAADSLPRLPMPPSIARELIDDWLAAANA